MAVTGQGLPSDSGNAEFSLAAIRAVKLTLLDSGLDDEQILDLFGRVALEHADAAKIPEWTAELNKRRFELIDGDIQGTLSREERLELAGLTQIMRQPRSESAHPANGPELPHAAALARHVDADRRFGEGT